jgi:uncharacterized protein YbjT (DUF2867 family)
VLACLVTGATGSIGRALAWRLRCRASHLRLLARTRRGDLPIDAEQVTGDFADLASMERAFAGMEAVFLYTPACPDARLLQVAARQGVRHVVLLSSASVVKVAPEAANPVAERHRGMERHVQQAGFDATVLRPDTLATNCLAWADEIRRHARVSVPYPASLRNPIHEDDVAHVAARAMLDPGAFGGRSFLLTGPQPLSIQAQVEAIGHAIGQSIECRQIPAQAAIEGMSRGPSAMTVEVAARLVAYMEKTTRERPAVTADFLDVIGQPPRRFAEWAVDHAHAFRPTAVPTLPASPARPDAGPPTD